MKTTISRGRWVLTLKRLNSRAPSQKKLKVHICTSWDLIRCSINNLCHRASRLVIFVETSKPWFLDPILNVSKKIKNFWQVSMVSRIAPPNCLSSTSWDFQIRTSNGLHCWCMTTSMTTSWCMTTGGRPVSWCITTSMTSLKRIATAGSQTPI